MVLPLPWSLPYSSKKGIMEVAVPLLLTIQLATFSKTIKKGVINYHDWKLHYLNQIVKKFAAFNLLARFLNYERMQNLAGLTYWSQLSKTSTQRKKTKRLLLNVTWNSFNTHSIRCRLIIGKYLLLKKKEQRCCDWWCHLRLKLVWWVLWRVSEIQSSGLQYAHPWCPWRITLLRLVTSLGPLHFLYRMECDSVWPLVVHPRTGPKQVLKLPKICLVGSLQDITRLLSLDVYPRCLGRTLGIY